jgi:predicted metal-dependent hydrolase
MSELTVRRLRVDLETPFPRHWCGGDAFRTALFNALSMSFPAGEQIFIDAVKRSLAELPEAERARWATEVQGFIGQEATHRRIHERFNAQLATQGLVNHWERRILARRASLLEPAEPRAWAGVTAATEHWTAIFAQHLLAHSALLAGAEPRLADLWRWHSAEELEHRSTAFDLYRALGGNEKWRLRLFRVVSLNFVVDTLRQTVNNIWHDGTLFRPATWASAWRTLFGHEGLVRCSFGAWRAYLRSDFHPLQADGSAGERWLQANADLVPPVRPAVATT